MKMVESAATYHDIRTSANTSMNENIANTIQYIIHFTCRDTNN